MCHIPADVGTQPGKHVYMMHLTVKSKYFWWIRDGKVNGKSADIGEFCTGAVLISGNPNNNPNDESIRLAIIE